jgi:hypothetical protein
MADRGGVTSPNIRANQKRLMPIQKIPKKQKKQTHRFE